MFCQTCSAQIFLPHYGECNQHLDALLLILRVVFRGTIFLFLVCFSVFSVWRVNFFMSLHLIFLAYVWLVKNCDYYAASFFWVCTWRVLDSVFPDHEQGGAFSWVSGFCLNNCWISLDNLKTNIQNACIPVGCIIPCATRNIVKLVSSNVGSRWKRPVADELARAQMRVGDGTTVCCATRMVPTDVFPGRLHSCDEVCLKPDFGLVWALALNSMVPFFFR